MKKSKRKSNLILPLSQPLQRNYQNKIISDLYRKPKRTIKTAAQVRAEEEAKNENKYEKTKPDHVSTTVPST